MKTIALASGKGGAGKTSVAAALGAAFGLQGINADCDVDAANGAIALGARIMSSEDYWAGEGYAINASACSSCGACALACRFDAIARTASAYAIDEALCERCGACVDLCPSGAVLAHDKLGGALYVSKTRWDSTLVHAELVPGEDTSGKLVRAVRQRAEAIAAAANPPIEAIIIDAPPGIGCPVIASLSGVDLTVVVIEAGSSGVRDAARLFELLSGMKRAAIAVINKAGIDAYWDAQARGLAEAWNAPLIAVLPWDKRFRLSTERGEAWCHSPDVFVAGQARSLYSAVRSAAAL
ncbi:MAG TPA: (4Fe-4S)-binding protein [Spirochaetaceae bacterium]|nr:(4Fe-4S)-binding protein [Spirochaetaceae bacterium]